MSDGQWDADDFKPPVFKAPIACDKWEGEDEDDDVKDNWDDDEDAEQEQKKGEPESTDGVKAVQIKKKGTLKSKLKEKEEERRREKEEEDRKKQELKGPSKEELLEEKLRRQKLQEEADLELAKEAFGVNDLPKTGIDSIEPTNKDEFDILKKALVDKLTKYERTSLYLPFLDDLFRELCVNLEADDIKKLGSTLNAVSTEKAKVAKAQASKTKKKAGSSKKASLVVGKASDFDYADYGGGDEYEDFM